MRVSVLIVLGDDDVQMGVLACCRVSGCVCGWVIRFQRGCDVTVSLNITFIRWQ